MFSRRIITSRFLIFILCLKFYETKGNDCPPSDAILPCRCSQKGNEIQIWCSHSNLPQILEGIKSISRTINRPVDELILENNQLPALSGRFFSSLQISRLMLRHNNIERLSNGWLNELETSLVEIFIVERYLRSIPMESLNGLHNLEAITIQSEELKRLPSFSGLLNLKYINIQSNSIYELSSHMFQNLPNLQTIHINGGENLNRLESGLFENLPSLKTIDLSNNGINWIHLRALSRLSNLQYLKLTNNKLIDVQMIGHVIKDLDNLQKLRLDRNLITILKEGTFVDLSKLKDLYLNDNRITEIQYGAFHRVPNLRSIYLQNNLIKRIHPESFLQSSGVTGVENLYLQNNEINRIEELRSLLDTLPTLKFLDISNNYLYEIPFGILRGHGTLEQLYLNNNLIQLIERDSLIGMPALRELRLRNNSLSDKLQLPFWNLPGLKGLDLSLNQFNKIDSLLLTGLPSLRRLDLSENFLISIDPQTFLHTIMLETLNISYNELNHIHSSTFHNLNRLFEIDISHNHLNDIIPGLPKILERLSINNNDISSLPISITKSLNLPNLRMLDLSNNNLEYIPKFTFQSLNQLRVLILSGNRLRLLEDSTFLGLQRLEILYLYDNQIIEIQDKTFNMMNNLQSLNLQGNQIEILNDNLFMNTTNLEQLDLSRNILNQLTPMIFKNLILLKYLDLSNNMLPDIPDSLSMLMNLKDIDLSSNRLKYLPPKILSSWKNIYEIRLSNNEINDIKHGTVRNLLKLQYLDLSSNNINSIEPGSFHNLPDLQELVLADNKLIELKDHVFEDLPNLQAAHLQHNQLRYISPNCFYKSSSILYLNLSSNHFHNMENIGLRSMRNLEVLDLSSNTIKMISTMPLESLNWLVELKLDDNELCKIQGTPFEMMPRLRVLSMRNNRMKTMSERTFRNLRGNIAILDIDGNPILCTCEMLWLSVWLDETNSPNPGPRCQNGKLLRASRLDKNDCGDSRTTTTNQLPLFNEHGDMFQRQLNSEINDECDIPYTVNENGQRPLPGESEYFSDQYIDYPTNETIPIESNNNISNKIKNSPPTNINLNNTVLNYNLYNRPQRPSSQQSSPFSFFGYPLPNLNIGKYFGGRKSEARSQSPPSRGKVRMYRPDEIDFEKFLNNQETQYRDMPPRNPYNTQSSEEIGNSNGEQTFRTPFKTPLIEKGGFSPIVPGQIGGFRPISNPYTNENNERLETKQNQSIPQNYTDLFDENTEYDNLVPVITEIPKRRIQSNVLNVTDDLPRRNVHVFSDITTVINEIQEHTPEITDSPSYFLENHEIFSTEEQLKQSTTTNFPGLVDQSHVTIEDQFPLTSTSETILLIPPTSEQEKYPPRKYENFWENIKNGAGIVAVTGNPNIHKSIPRPTLGKSTITKVLSPKIPNLPTAEEYFRTTIDSDNDVQSNELVTNTYVQPEEIPKKNGMDWYYENYKDNQHALKNRDRDNFYETNIKSNTGSSYFKLNISIILVFVPLLNIL